MICELAIFASLFTFCRGQHMWRQRPIDISSSNSLDKKGKFGESVGHINSYVRHDHGFYNDGSNSGYFGKNKGVDSDDPKYLNKYGIYGPQNGEICRHDGLMRQAEENVAYFYRRDNYVAYSIPPIRKHHNCHDYKHAANMEYDRMYRENGNRFERNNGRSCEMNENRPKRYWWEQ